LPCSASCSSGSHASANHFSHRLSAYELNSRHSSHDSRHEAAVISLADARNLALWANPLTQRFLDRAAQAECRRRPFRAELTTYRRTLPSGAAQRGCQRCRIGSHRISGARSRAGPVSSSGPCAAHKRLASWTVPSVRLSGVPGEHGRGPPYMPRLTLPAAWRPTGRPPGAAAGMVECVMLSQVIGVKPGRIGELEHAQPLVIRVTLRAP
jgi:hypothetical protein